MNCFIGIILILDIQIFRAPALPVDKRVMVSLSPIDVSFSTGISLRTQNTRVRMLVCAHHYENARVYETIIVIVDHILTYHQQKNSLQPLARATEHLFLTNLNVILLPEGKYSLSLRINFGSFLSLFGQVLGWKRLSPLRTFKTVFHQLMKNLQCKSQLRQTRFHQTFQHCSFLLLY